MPDSSTIVGTDIAYIPTVRLVFNIENHLEERLKKDIHILGLLHIWYILRSKLRRISNNKGVIIKGIINGYWQRVGVKGETLALEKIKPTLRGFWVNFVQLQKD